jgi:putative endonuclease
MHYTYILKSKLDDGIYIGCTGDLKNRFKEHSMGKVKSTKNRQPLVLIYYEACLNIEDSFKREKYLKSTYGRRYLKNRLKTISQVKKEKEDIQKRSSNTFYSLPEVRCMKQ